MVKKRIFSFSCALAIFSFSCLYGASVEFSPPEAPEEFASHLQATIDALTEDGERHIQLPAGRFLLSSQIRVPSNFRLSGAGPGVTVLEVSTPPEQDLIRVENASEVTIDQLSLVQTGERGKPKGAAIEIVHGSKAVKIQDVHTYGFRSGISIGRDNNETPNSGIILRDCQTQAALNFGIEVNDVRLLTIDSCRASFNRLDGIKLRKNARNVTLMGGESSNNGVEGPNGNGLDAYAGGEALVIENTLVENNNGSGIYIKTGPLNDQDFGIVGRVQISGIRARKNSGSGLDINRSGGDIPDTNSDRVAVLPAHFLVVGGLYEENGSGGIYVRGTDITLMGVICRANAKSGIALSTCWNVDIISPMVAFNGLSQPGTFPGITIGGPEGAHHVTVSGGFVQGADVTTFRSGFDTPEEVTHSNAIYISKNSTDILIERTKMTHYAQKGVPVRVRGENQDQVIVHYGMVDSLERTGGAGSTCFFENRHYVYIKQENNQYAWLPETRSFALPAEQRPANPKVGDMLYDTTLKKPLWWNGSEWQ